MIFVRASVAWTILSRILLCSCLMLGQVSMAFYCVFLCSVSMLLCLPWTSLCGFSAPFCSVCVCLLLGQVSVVFVRRWVCRFLSLAWTSLSGVFVHRFVLCVLFGQVFHGLFVHRFVVFFGLDKSRLCLLLVQVSVVCFFFCVICFSLGQVSVVCFCDFCALLWQVSTAFYCVFLCSVCGCVFLLSCLHKAPWLPLCASLLCTLFVAVVSWHCGYLLCASLFCVLVSLAWTSLNGFLLCACLFCVLLRLAWTSFCGAWTSFCVALSLDWASVSGLFVRHLLGQTSGLSPILGEPSISGKA